MVAEATLHLYPHQFAVCMYAQQIEPRSGEAVPQEVEQVFCLSERQRFDPRLLQSAYWSVRGQDTEP